MLPTLLEQFLLKRNSVFCSQKFTMLREHHIFIVRIYFQNNLYLSMQRQSEKFPDVPVPYKSTIKRLVDKFNTAGHVDDLLHSGKLHTATIATKWDEVCTLVEENPQTSTHRLAAQTSISPWSVRCNLCALTKEPYCIVVVQELSPNDSGRPKTRCKWLEHFVWQNRMQAL